MLKFAMLPAASFGALLLVAATAVGQPASPGAEAPPGMDGGMRMPMQGGMMGMMMGDDGCPMMRRMASMDERLRRLEERSGVPAPPAAPGAAPSR